ncbi:hypothetical protein GMA11_06740 [Granulicatella sp. zg-ZJ]|uniref:hypothetical protein n=1 Tax=Granulicatella sp. zg-ZJ TaxID=2678504 RepID=UPI0013D3A536|nr:hypothetical protein [Granulicatella sp. zg-ZJ]NEW63090.1 hypothetical protein [Granulicatella sp. zg-ZJ]
MKKLIKAALWVGSLAGAYVLLTPKQKREEQLEHAKIAIDNIKQSSKSLMSSVGDVKEQVAYLKDDAAPFLQETIQDVQRRVKQFTQENQPRFRRIQEKLQTLQEDLKNMNKTDDRA